MDQDSLLAELRAWAAHDGSVGALYQLVERWESEGIGEAAIEPLLRFIEDDPSVDLGTPGPLVHFLETFRGRYEEPLVQSLQRRPAEHTIWMLNRLLNGEPDPQRLQRYLAVMHSIAANSQADPELRGHARDFLDFQRQRGLA